MLSAQDQSRLQSSGAVPMKRLFDRLGTIWLRLLLEMINEVLDLSRVESGKVSVELRSLELPKFIAGIVDEFQLRAAHGQLRFIHEIHGELPPWIETDPIRLRQVLYNLLGNAVKFTTQGEIALRVHVTSEQLRFEVKDPGKGIPQADLPSIFKPF